MEVIKQLLLGRSQNIDSVKHTTSLVTFPHFQALEFQSAWKTLVFSSMCRDHGNLFGAMKISGKICALLIASVSTVVSTH